MKKYNILFSCIIILFIQYIYACTDDFLAPPKITGVGYVNHDTCKIIISGNWQDNDFSNIKVSGRSENLITNYNLKVMEYNRFKGDYIIWQSEKDWLPDSIVRAILPGSYSGDEFHVP